MSSGIITILIFIFLFKSANSSKVIDKTQLFILLSLLCWVAAEFLYGYYGGFLEIDPYPSPADLLYITGYLFFILFLVSINAKYKLELAFIVSSLVTFSLLVFYVLYISIFVYQVSDFGGSIYDLILLFTYPIFDLFIIAGSIMYYFRGRTISLDKENNYWIFIAFFGFFSFIADLAYGYNDIFNITNNDYLFDLLYNIGYLLLGIAIIIRLSYSNIQRKYRLI